MKLLRRGLGNRFYLAFTHQTDYYSTVSHISAYQDAMKAQWGRSFYSTAIGFKLLILSGSGWRQFTVFDENHQEVARGRVTQLPGCASGVITSRGLVASDMRGTGLGRVIHTINQRALGLAGFRFELVTVREDNQPMMSLMRTNTKSKILDRQLSDHGGYVVIWRTNLD